MTTPWIQTRSGQAIDLLNPDPTTIVLGDLAYALAYLNRYTGHAGAYSVAQHSVLTAWALRDEGHSEGVQRAGLMHDAHEAIVGDVSSPVKRALARASQGVDAFQALEARVWEAVSRRFALPFSLPEAVKVADLRMLLTEKRDLLPEAEPRPWGIPGEPYAFKVRPWGAEYARAQFLVEAGRLGVL